MEGSRPKKVPCPFDPSSPLTLLSSGENSFTERLAKVAEVPPEQFQLDIANQVGLKQELDLLLHQSREQLEVIKRRAEDLKLLLRDKFEIDDAEKWLAEQQETRNREKSITLTMYTLI